MTRSKNIVYLYSEVMPYAIAVMRTLVSEHGMNVDCIRWDLNKRTPFEPVDDAGITFHKRSLFDEGAMVKFIEERNPSIIYVVGRMDRLYLKTALHFKNKCVIVSGSDNQWQGGMKQVARALLGKVLYRRYFEYFWVPGKRQYEFAKKMGYTDETIISNLLTADTAIFNRAYQENRREKAGKYPHTMVFAGRFSEEKGLDILIEAFSEAKGELQNDWRLVLVGKGSMAIRQSPFIEVKGFMSSEELANDSKRWGVFCLPSNYEPWGVVVHEFAAAGLPFICSDKVGAADDLVIGNDNGFVFRSGSKSELKTAIIGMMMKSDHELFTMGEVSHELSKTFSPSIAAESLMSILE